MVPKKTTCRFGIQPNSGTWYRTVRLHVFKGNGTKTPRQANFWILLGGCTLGLDSARWLKEKNISCGSTPIVPKQDSMVSEVSLLFSI